jgi:hypothetical protein
MVEKLMPLPIAALLPVVGKVLDRVLPDQGARDEAERQLTLLQQQGELKQVEAQMSAIIAEAQSSDPWTSRARPSFLYVVYACILAGIPMGILFAISPDIATNVTTGFKDWLQAIPEEMWTLFGVGYLGYTGARSIDKRK